ncbi:MAG: ferrochelatase [Terriglobia bacterium]|jgi:protoporphyrin/coproporphyrin ferrochelatase
MERESNPQPRPVSWGVLLLAHGAPDQLEDIPEFLLNVRGGRPLPEAIVKEITHRYSLIGGGSPLLRLTTLQAEGLARLIAHPVYVGMRNWNPFIPEAVRRLSDDGVERIVAVCLAPQNSRTSIGLYRKCLMDAVAQVCPGLVVDFVESYHDHPGLIEAFRERAAAALHAATRETGGPVPVIFTAHSVPERTIAEGDPYERQVRETAALVARAMAITEYRVAFQSQGMTAEKWIGPTVESQIDELAQTGGKNVLLIPVGFVSDHVEILYDIDVLFRHYGKARGVAVRRSESLNASPQFVSALASLVTARIGIINAKV